MTKYPMKNAMIRECEEEIAFMMSGIVGSSRFIKVLCRNRVAYLRWKISRIEKDKDFDVEPSTKNVTKFEMNL